MYAITMSAKKLILTQKQLNEIIGYCDNVPDDYANNADNEVFIGDTHVDNEGNENYGEPIITDKFGHSITNDVGALWKIGGVSGNLVMRESRKKKIVKNDEGKIVPEICPECGSKVGVFIQGEPIYKCTNKKCGKYFGTMPFPKNLKEDSAHGNNMLANEKFGANDKFHGNTYNGATVKKHRYEKAKQLALNGTEEEKEKAQKTLERMQQNSLQNGENIEQTIGQLGNREKQTAQLRKNKLENGETILNVANRSQGGKAHSNKNTDNNQIINYF